MKALPAVMAACVVVALTAGQADDGYLSWSAKQAEAIGAQAYKRGRVGGVFDTRILKTERSYNYKLAATWLTPDVIRATARRAQLASRLSPDETRALVAEAEAPEGTVILVEIDPREGSGVIPLDWEAFLQPEGRPDAALRGVVQPRLRDVRALAGVMRRNYDYDRFWVTFPRTHAGTPLFAPDDRIAELVVRVHNKEGRVQWPIPDAFRRPAAGTAVNR